MQIYLEKKVCKQTKSMVATSKDTSTSIHILLYTIVYISLSNKKSCYNREQKHSNNLGIHSIYQCYTI